MSIRGDIIKKRNMRAMEKAMSIIDKNTPLVTAADAALADEAALIAFATNYFTNQKTRAESSISQAKALINNINTDVINNVDTTFTAEDRAEFADIVTSHGG